MDDPTILTHVLTQCNSTAPKQRNTVNTFGVDTCQEFYRQNDEDMRNLLYIIQTNNRNLVGIQLMNVTIMAKKILSSMRKEFKTRNNYNAIYDAIELNVLDTDEIDTLVIKHNEWEDTYKTISA